MNVEKVQKISVFGGGLMGGGISQVFAFHGYNIMVYDIDLGRESLMRSKIRENLKLTFSDRIEEKKIKDIEGRISFTTSLNTAAEYADFIVESVPENMDLKQKLFAELDAICNKDVVLASNTSVMSITEIASKCKNRQRIIGTHFWNPPFLLPLVEVVRTKDTDENYIKSTMLLLEKVGKHPILVKKDVPGFVANRLQHALWREAVSIVEHDIADAKTVDDAIKYSFGLRLPVLAPLENADYVGTDLTLAIHQYILPYLENSCKASPYLENLVKNDRLGFKTGQGFLEWNELAKKTLEEKLIKHLVKTVLQ